MDDLKKQITQLQYEQGLIESKYIKLDNTVHELLVEKANLVNHLSELRQKIQKLQEDNKITSPKRKRAKIGHEYFNINSFSLFLV